MSQTTFLTTEPPPSLLHRLTRPFFLGGLFVVITFSLLYTFTLDTGLMPEELKGGDLITHQYAQVQARPSNAPGYPIYTMGGWLWFHGWHTLMTWLGNPYPNPMPILSSYSTLWAILALWLLYLILGTLLANRRHSWAATLFCILVTSFYGVTYFFWYYATTTEQYSSAIAHTLAIFYIYLLWDRKPARRSLLYLLAFLCGLSLAHMLTVAFIVPPLLIAVLWRDPTLLRSPRAIFTGIVAALIPLVSYVYVYLRGALNPNWWGRGYWETPQAWFWSFVGTAQGRDELSWAFEPGRTFFGNGFPEAIWQELSLPLLILGLIGIFLLPRRQAFVLYGTIAIYLIFCWLYRFGNWFQVILPVYPLILIGLCPLYSRIDRSTSALARTGKTMALALLSLLVIWRISASWPETNSRNRPEDTALNRAALLLNQPLPEDARLFAAVNDALAISYLTEIWSIRPDIKTVNSRDANADLTEGLQVFTTIDATPALLAELTLTPTIDGLSADWIQLSTTTALTTTDVLTGAPIYTVTPDLALTSMTTTPLAVPPPLTSALEPALDVTLFWSLPSGIWPQDLFISVRPTYQGVPQVDPANGQPIQSDRSRPVFGLWRDVPNDHSLGETGIIHDPYRLPQPDSLPAPADGVLIILYKQVESGYQNIAEIQLSLADISR